MSLEDKNLDNSIKEKIYDYKHQEKTITTYFPLTNSEKQTIKNVFGNIKFKTIFTDRISEKEWNQNKAQIINKFKDELFRIG